MGFFRNLVGAGPEVADVVGAAGKALDGLFTSKDEKLSHQEILERIQQNPQKWQTQINLAEATHRSVFVAGWRPFIGWVCGVALAYHFIARDLLEWAFAVWSADVTPPPKLDIGDLLTLLGGLLGLGALRTSEKKSGVAK